MNFLRVILLVLTGFSLLACSPPVDQETQEKARAKALALAVRPPANGERQSSEASDDASDSQTSEERENAESNE